MKTIFKLAFALLFLILLNSCSGDRIYDVTRFGADSKGLSLSTKSIQSAIDKASSIGGGVVFVPNGTFLSGTIFLKSNITLRLASGATILGSPNISDYTELTWGHNVDRQPYHLIVAKGAENVVIEGKGTIDGNGEAFWKEYEKDSLGRMITPRWISAKDKKVSPLIEIDSCTNVTISDVTIKTGGGWNLHLFNSQRAFVRGINIINNLYSPNSDGIDITGCYDVMVSDCYIKTCDDAICLKTTPDSRDCRRITVTNCILETLCVGLKMGCNESYKDMTDVTFSNCVINNSSRAIGLYVHAGATYDRITISNITANTNAPLIFNRPIQLMTDLRAPGIKTGTIRNVLISNFVSSTNGRIMLSAEDSTSIENIVLRDIVLNYPLIEDPTPYFATASSNQFPRFKKHPELGGAKAAIVAENIKNLVVENLIVNWPNSDSVPLDWRHIEKIENGSKKIHTPDYSTTRPTEFSVLWGKNIQGGWINAPLAKASAASQPNYQLINSTFTVK